MNEEMQDLTADTLAKVLEYVEATEGFVIEQAPLLCHEIVRYGVWGNIIPGVLLGFTALTLTAVCGKVLVWGGGNHGNVDKEVAAEFFGMLGVAIGVCMSIPALVFLTSAFKPMLAPRLYIIEELSRLL